MRIPRIYIDIPLNTQKTIVLDERAFQHTVKVLRLREGAEIILFNGAGGEYSAHLHQVTKKKATAQLDQYIDNNCESPLSTHLALGISKGERMDFAIQKAVELGITDITPLYTERCVVNLDNRREEKRMEHWRGVIISACEQSGRNSVPELHQPVDIKRDFSALPVCELKLILSPYVTKCLKDINPPGKSVMILIGPEGGLSKQEIEMAEKYKFNAVRMGPRILRTETAALTAISAIQILWGDLAV